MQTHLSRTLLDERKLVKLFEKNEFMCDFFATFNHLERNGECITFPCESRFVIR